MNESAVYNESDVSPFQRRLRELRQIVQHDIGTGKHPEALTKLLERQLHECGQYLLFYSKHLNFILSLVHPQDAIVQSLQDSLSVLSAEIIPIHERLVTIRRQLVALAAKEGSHKAELRPLQEELRKIDSLSTRFVREVC